MTKMCTNCVNTTLLSMMSYCQSGSLVNAPVQTGVVLVAAPRVLLPTTVPDFLMLVRLGRCSSLRGLTSRKKAFLNTIIRTYAI